mgnify:CR=1 FL=1
MRASGTRSHPPQAACFLGIATLSLLNQGVSTFLRQLSTAGPQHCPARVWKAVHWRRQAVPAALANRANPPGRRDFPVLHKKQAIPSHSFAINGLACFSEGFPQLVHNPVPRQCGKPQTAPARAACRAGRGRVRVAPAIFRASPVRTREPARIKGCRAVVVPSRSISGLSLS